MMLFHPMLSNSPTHLTLIDTTFVRAHGILFSGKPLGQLKEPMDSFIKQLDSHIDRSAKRWLEPGSVDAENYV
jgi:hypothetical protein